MQTYLFCSSGNMHKFMVVLLLCNGAAVNSYTNFCRGEVVFCMNFLALVRKCLILI